ncbi:MAG: roadblock/LC7 domain-containing protein [Deltaproteobacteria bacterium]|nr:roadblock/LC7 domain-containing protein [Deltaproteobacteria bacterium]
MNLVLSRESIYLLESILEKELLCNGVDHAFIIDTAGTLISEGGKLPMEDILPLAALSAANFGATEKMARMIGEKDFSLLFHKGTTHNIHLSRINKDFILVALFGNDVAIGLIRHGSNKAAEQIIPILTNEEDSLGGLH